MTNILGETYYKRLIVFYIPLFLFLIFLLFPFYFMFISSIKDPLEFNEQTVPPLWAERTTLGNWKTLFNDTMFIPWLINSLVIALGSTAISLFCGVFGGYALSRLQFVGSTSLGVFIFATYLVPPALLFIPLTDIVAMLGLMDSRWSLILSYPTIMAPFCTWLLMGYFKTIPTDLEDCARVDGATRFQAFYKIIVPLAVPGILSAGIFSFTLSWNEFLYSLVFISSPENKTVPVGVVTALIRFDIFDWGAIMSGALFGCIPVALIYSFFVEYYVTGLTGGAVKG